jgi:hypothetical protein
MADQGDEGFLPPEPAGPEPDLGEPQAPPPPAPPPQPQQPPQPGWGAPNAGFPTGYQQQPPPGYAPPQQGWQPQPAWAPPAGAQPDNGPAVTGFVLTMVSAGLWMLSAGLSSVISITCAVLGIVYSRRGKQKVESGKTQKHKSLAQAGYIGGIVMTVLATLSTLAWILVLVLYLTDDQFRNDLEEEFDETGRPAALLLAGAALRLVRLGLS